MTSNSERENFPSRGGNGVSDGKFHERCVRRLDRAFKRSAYVKFMLDAMKKVGCEVDVGKHVVCEPCSGKVLGGFDPYRNQVVLCENTVYSQGSMEDTLTHELIHAYDHCRAKIDWDNLKHLACTEIRAANLSGDCFFWKENFARLKFGWRKHQQKCVRARAVESILCVRDVERVEAEAAVDSVFSQCFNDTDPFERIPP
ncbi:mitochondrial inner membrane protease ATP23 homolog [Oscarella lobularis]|uniref:mitochondrial inner membrane protease ATP23 homolog n=1 Tax=Oscarella lobularis TaxID=121494 RepID=UPI0033141796